MSESNKSESVKHVADWLLMPHTALGNNCKMEITHERIVAYLTSKQKEIDELKRENERLESQAYITDKSHLRRITWKDEASHLKKEFTKLKQSNEELLIALGDLLNAYSGILWKKKRQSGNKITDKATDAINRHKERFLNEKF